jgi:hypothetical protein
MESVSAFEATSAEVEAAICRLRDYQRVFLRRRNALLPFLRLPASSGEVLALIIDLASSNGFSSGHVARWLPHAPDPAQVLQFSYVPSAFRHVVLQTSSLWAGPRFGRGRAGTRMLISGITGPREARAAMHHG